MKKIYIDWENVGIMIDKLIEKVKLSKIKFDGIYGVPRGGLPVAIALSHHLKLPLLVYPTSNCLVVDDISDTGVTLRNMKRKKIACLFSSRWTDTDPDFYVNVKNDKDSWIVFPWEDSE